VASGGNGGGVFLGGCAGTLTGNTISGNSSTGGWGGGGVYVQDQTPTVTMTGDTISGNLGTPAGGGLLCSQTSPKLTNEIITGNATDYGGGLYCDGASPVLTNDTISGNLALNLGGGVWSQSSAAPVIKNTIVAFNTFGGGLVTDGSGSFVVTYSDVYGNPMAGNTGANFVGLKDPTGTNGNLSKNPLFANAAAADFHLESKGGCWNGKAWVKDTVTSPCIDAGDPTSAYNLQPTPNGGRIEMGAYGDTPTASKADPPKTSSVTALTAIANCGSAGMVQITVHLASAASVQATIINVAGREVAVLPEQELTAGVSTMQWNGRSTLGTKVPAGRYMVRVTARTPDGGQAQTIAALTLSS
jgi:hypothetical protein